MSTEAAEEVTLKKAELTGGTTGGTATATTVRPGTAPQRASRRLGPRRRLGLGRPVPYGWALGPLLLLAVWAAAPPPA